MKATIRLKNQPKTNTKITAVLAVFLLLSTLHSNSQVLGNWNFNNTLTGVPGLLNGVSNADFSPLVTTRAYNGGSEYFGENNWPAGGLDPAAYMQFSVWPLLGYQLNMNNVVIRMRRSNTGIPAGSGPTAWSVRSSVDGFTNDIASGPLTLNYANFTVPMPTGFLFMLLPVTFRVYGYASNTASAGSSRLVFDNIALNGIGGALPIKMTSFTANNSASAVNLNFSLEQTEKGTSYQIERSTDTRNYTSIHSIIETSANGATYSYADYQLPENASDVYYRIKIKAPDGAITYSSVISVKLVGETASSKYQFSTSGSQLYIKGKFKSEYYVEVLNLSGVRVATFNPGTTGTSLVLSLPSGIAKGNYIAVVKGNDIKQSSVIVVR